MKKHKHTRKILLIFFIIIAGWFLIHSFIITADGLNDRVHKADCILILGNTVNYDGTLSDRLRGRVEKGLQLYKDGFAPKIVVSGGLGKEGYYEGIEMKRYLTERGVSPKAVIVDNKGINTYETAKVFAEIAEAQNINSVIVVSQFFHITRTKYILKKKSTVKVYSAHAEYFEWKDFYAVFREFFGFYAYVLLKH